MYLDWEEAVGLDTLGLVKFGYDVLKDLSKQASKYITADDWAVNEALTGHVIRAEAWSSSINMLGMSAPADVAKQSIAVSISSQPRKFHATRDPDALFGEERILETPSSVVVLGDPGAGKTTVIKRLIRQLILAAQEEHGEAYDFPILIFGRDITPHSDLFRHIFTAMALTERPPARRGERDKDFEDWQINRQTYVREAVTSALLSMPVVIFVDGMDEIDPTARGGFDRDLEYLNHSLTKGKIVATCRSGDWHRALSGFEVYEISPLSEGQVEEISRLWAKKPEAFSAAIATIPYREILDRPLLLTLLIVIYNQTGGLPAQPVDIYHRFVNLLIAEWDEQRDLTRSSRFADFQAGRKHKFLADAAYQLMMMSSSKRFSGQDLRRALHSTALRFGQSQDEIEAVVRELESHTGILVESGFGNYEFCHLTVQEYLAATYFMALPGRRRDLEAVVHRSPATLAVAVSLSSDPADYLAESLLELLHPGSLRHPAQAKFLKSFFARLRLERPTLTPSHKLGLAALLVAHSYDTDPIVWNSVPEFQTMWDEIASFLADEAVEQSLALAEGVVRYEPVGGKAPGLQVSLIPGSYFAQRLGPEFVLFFSRSVLNLMRGTCTWLFPS
jgi:GTPase SAR1 family protein